MDKIRFIYNGKQYQTGNLERQLQRLGITEQDIEFIKKERTEYEQVKLYHFRNPKTGRTIMSCLPDLEHLRNVKGYNVDEWVPVDEFELQSIKNQLSI